MLKELLISLSIGLCCCVPGALAAADEGTAKEAAVEPAKEGLPFEQLRIFSEVYARIRRDYVEEVDDEKLIEDAIKGMLSGLDPHSSYLGQEAWSDLKEGTAGKFGGLGIEVEMEDGLVKVIAPIDDTPAARAGIQAGDRIVRIDDTPIKGMSLSEAVDLMRGEPDTSINLTIMREGTGGMIDVKLVRDIIRVRSVKGRILEPGYFYVRIAHFQEKTTKELVKTLNGLLKQSGGKVNGLVLDLRNNPGGLLSAAVGVADTFLSDGIVVYTEGRVKESRLKFRVQTPRDMLNGAPMVVLLNGGSASASEIVAGSLQDHQRALIVGQPSFGKGSVQTIMPMKSGEEALKITTALYYTPKGRSIQAQGIVPDVPLARLEVSSDDQTGVKAIKEADLSGHLNNGNGKTDEQAEAAVRPPADAKFGTGQALAAKDFELYEALNLLKGMALLRSRGGVAPAVDPVMEAVIGPAAAPDSDNQGE